MGCKVMAVWTASMELTKGLLNCNTYNHVHVYTMHELDIRSYSLFTSIYHVKLGDHSKIISSRMWTTLVAVTITIKSNLY